jgi:CheY-like chemotaxis protein
MRQILLVDDDDFFRKMLMLKLTKWAYNVIEARNGQEALRLHHHVPPDLVLIDLIMPEKEGLETIRELKQAHSSAKIVAMSGGSRLVGTDFLTIAKFMGADHTLAKPFSDEDLTAILETLLTGNPSTAI